MQAAISNPAPEKKLSAAFAAALHIALLALLLSFRPDVGGLVEPDPPLAVDLVPAPEPVEPIVEPAPVVVARGETASLPSRHQAGRDEAGAPAPKALREDMDRTLANVPVASFPPGPAPATGVAADGAGGTGLAGDGFGTGAGGRGSGMGKAALDAPHWISKPTWSQMKQYNPPQAAAERVSGTALLSCRIDSSQRARNCRVLRETPRGYGFGSAALATVRFGRIRPAMRDGIPAYDAWVAIPISFDNCSAADPGCADTRD